MEDNFGRFRPVVTGLAPHTACPTNTTMARIIISLARFPSMSGRPGFAARSTLRPLSTAISCPTSLCRDRLVGIDVCEAPAVASVASASSPTRSTDVSGPNTAPGGCRSPQASGPQLARHGASSTPWSASDRTGWARLAATATGGDRDGDENIAASAQLAEVGCAVAMPSSQLRTSFVTMASTRRTPNAGLIHRRTLNANVFRVGGLLAFGLFHVRNADRTEHALAA